jgi:heme/copper-type cytochrome/quinol oxidase subunit 2
MMSFQCPATDYAQSLIIMHNYLMTFLFGIGIFVSFIMGYLVLKCMFQASTKKYQVRVYSMNSLYNSYINLINDYIFNSSIITNFKDVIIAQYLFNTASTKYSKENFQLSL